SNLPTEERWFESANRDYDVLQLIVFDEGVRVGMVELNPIDRETGVAELAFWIHPDHREHGYGREAIAVLLEYTFDELRVHKVTANAFASNEASRNLLTSLGFTEEGIGREDTYMDGVYADTHYYGILEDEWDGSG
ncbi:MAG: GNAT family protein, partial [Halobacteriales archaeon]|nr:GNAT family protein [Halobacteriales archaeon]